ncbi:hypothetical protein ACIPW5_11515 [Streptomyces sp. NPDC090077]|uniref:hypothetical protein n=1 Tax=Streptomyces sp. NPDC090077 TaxID=3365938 RepID=UPI003814ECE2
MTQRRALLPADPSDLWRTLKRLERTISERAGQLLTALRRPDGTLAFSGTAGWTWYDQGGTAILAEDAFSGQGLALPYLAMAAAPARYTDWPGSTSGTFEDIHRISAYKQQASAFVIVGHTSDAGPTTGEFQVTVNGSTVAAATAVTFSQAATTIGPFALPGAIRDQIDIRVQARRTAGAGSVKTTVLAASQIQS